MEYKIITNREGYLENEIMNYIKEGFEPIGGVSIAINQDGYMYESQAIIKK